MSASTTGIDNLFLAGEWVKTDQNVTMMEGANEGGRQSANGVLDASGSREPRVHIEPLSRAPWWEPFKAVDRDRYRAKLPNVFDIFDARVPSWHRMQEGRFRLMRRTQAC